MTRPPVKSPFVVRRMRPDDVSFVADFAERYDAPALNGELERPVARVWVAIAPDESRAGYTVLWVVDGSAELHEIEVLVRYRRRGVARALVCFIQQRVDEVHLEVRADNTAARALYAETGFEETGTRTGYYPGGIDAVLMSWSS